MSTFRNACYIAGGLLLLLVAGCGKSGLIPVQGVLTLDGTPVEGAMIAFISEDGGSAAQGWTKPDGKFALESGDQTGIKPGKYKVTVFKVPMGFEKTAAAPKSEVPAMYASKDKSPLSVVIPPPQGQEVKLEMKSQL